MTGSLAIRRAELQRKLARFLVRAANREIQGFLPSQEHLVAIRSCQAELAVLDAIDREVAEMEAEGDGL